MVASRSLAPAAAIALLIDLVAAGVQNVACSTCVPSSTCFQESSSMQFETQPVGTVNGFFAAVGGCIAKPTGTYNFTNPATGVTVTNIPLYLTTDGTALQDYLANSTVGTKKALVCFTNTSYSVVDKYVYVSHIPTDPLNFACPNCTWYNVFTISKPPNCICRYDTAWAFPLKPVLTSWTSSQAQSTSEIALPSTYYPGSPVYWTARADTSAWGGFFRFQPAASNPNRVSTTTTYAFDMCAGCAQNSIGKGYIMGKVNFTFTSVNGSTSTSLFFAPSPGATTTSSALQVYQSYIAPPTFNPGQFQLFDSYTTITAPFTYGFPFAVTKINTGNITVGANALLGTVPNAMTANGVYLAIHMNVNGAYCEGSPAYNTVLP
ncbi:hypothetical protein HYH02_005899 [Chlamydomonas schloesseri]|uniref:Uncharacterized protein n=1 Tax=Chlamydomonas schloesseri TaxID=2026947 RepID=A0A836B6L9_9CHLO|nr:hypothetical protein HYH02_005899 [Chlamydomonas schloesseri]|eukprot:KAG2449152.1 hypothetical protein HYH02_005899 [Chlamydomonas schloesseri]